MSEQKSELKLMMPYIIISGVLFVIIMVFWFWPSSESDVKISQEEVSPPSVQQAGPSQEEQEDKSPSNSAAEQLEMPKLPNEVVVGGEENASEVLAPIVEEQNDEDRRLDISDQVVKAAVVSAVKSDTIRSLLVDDALLERFVINVSELANQGVTLKDSLLIPPSSKFKLYQQAGRWWIDDSSYQRYSPYLDALESLDVAELVEVYESYKPQLIQMYSEISRPNENLDASLLDAIDILLATPEPQLPLEVVVETVMYRFADSDIEALSSAQKQMIRLGPDNMRRFKTLLSDIKVELKSRLGWSD